MRFRALLLSSCTAALVVAVAHASVPGNAPVQAKAGASAAAAPVVAVVADAPAAATPVAAPPVPLLWKVSDADNSIYLLGSFHALRSSDWPLAPAVDAAFADAEHVAFELSPEDLASPEVPMRMMQAAMLPPDQALRTQVDAETWTKLEAYAQANGLPLEMFAHTEPWFVALLVTVTEMQKLGLDPEQGLDRQLAARAVAAGKATSGLESVGEQIAALHSMTPEEQRQALQESLQEAAKFKLEMDDLHALWRSGDDTGLFDRMGRELREKYPALYQRVDVDRNRAWLPKVKAMLDAQRSDDALVVVGSLHLLGEDGLVSQLQRSGYRVERLR
jgi:uncharacterized protein YbaP (TraB family)